MGFQPLLDMIPLGDKKESGEQQNMEMDYRLELNRGISNKSELQLPQLKPLNSNLSFSNLEMDDVVMNKEIEKKAASLINDKSQ
jgi:hypothetical protein